MTQYPLLPDYPLSHPVDPNATPAPYVPVLYHVDADTQRFISPLTWRPPLMAQALPHIRFSAITTFKIKPYSNGVPLIIDTQSLVLVRIADRDRTPVHSTYATASEEGYYTVTLDLVNLPANVSDGQGFIELSINAVVLLSDRCTLGTALWPYNEQPRFPYETIYNVEGGSIVFTSTPSMYQLPPIPSTQPELDLTVTPSGSTVTNKLLFYSEAPSLIINVDGATLKGDYVCPGWYCALMVEEDNTITLHLSQLTDLYTESINTVRGFNPILVEDEWPTYGRRDSFYIHTTTREARIWTGGEWYPVGSSEYKYAPKSDVLPLPTGVASKGVEEKYAAGDHVHPFSIELTTNHLDTAFATPTDTHVPSSKLVKDTLDQIKSDLEDEISSLPGDINVSLSTKVDKVEGKDLSTNDLTDELLETLEGSEQKFNKDLNFDTPTNGRYPSTLAVSTALGTKVDKVEGKGLSTNDLTNELVTTINGSEQTPNKATTLSSPDDIKYPTTLAVSTALNGKVDKVTGKGLSTNDYTTAEKNKLASALTSLPNATTDAKGIIELATEAEVTAGTLTDRAVAPSTLKVELDKKVDKVSGYDLSKNDLTDARLATLTGAEQTNNRVDDITEAESTNYPSVLALRSALSSKVDIQEGHSLYPSTDALKVATIQNETLTTINGITAEIEPWSRSRWTITGDCEFTLAEGWNDTGRETAYILLTVRSGALLAGPSSVIFDNSLDQGEGVYEVELINLDGVIHFRWTECYPVNSIKFYVTTTAPNQTYTINALGVSASTDVGWGDGSLNTYTGEVARTHVYAAPGTYEVRILPAENVVLLNLQGALVSEVNSVDLKAASNMKTLRLMNLTSATGVIDTADMVDWPMTQHFYLYKNPLLSINVDSAHMVGWNPTVIYLSRLTNGNITINTENMAGWTNLENIVLEVLPTLGGSLDTLHFAGWSNFRSITLYELSVAFSVRFHTEDLTELPIQALHLFDYDGRNTVVNTADLSTKAMTYFRLYKLPLSVATVNSADMLLWDLSYLAVSTTPSATGTIDFADLAGFNLGTFAFIGCPLLTFIEDQSALLSWTSLALLQISNCTFSTEQMDRTLYGLYTAAPYRTVTGGTISFGGTSSSAPSGVYEAPDCPVVSSTPGRGIAYALKNDSCSLGFNKWATVTIK